MRFLAVAFSILLLAACSSEPPVGKAPQPAPQSAAVTPDNTLVFELTHGTVKIQLRPDLAPRHVERVKQLAREKFYDGLVWHRVITDFMAQTGDPTGTGTGGSKYGNVPAEFTQEPFVEGTVGAARTQDPNSANSQFFICLAPAPHLNGQYTVWGKVIEGMDAVHKIKKGAPGSGSVSAPDKILKGYLQSEART